MLKRMSVCVVGWITLGCVAMAVPPAFPGAEGAGMYSVGGRGGVVYEVTNLNDSGPGSFRAACDASGPRTVVFRVSGTIQALSRISIMNPYITIAGQTAPGDGICIRDKELFIRTHNVIVRYMKFRRGQATGGDSLNVMYGADNVIIDHCTATWGSDENLTCYDVTNVTIQWCMVGEGFYGHSCGGLWGPNASYHHNLIYSNGTRNPKLAYGAEGKVWDFRNNVIYNWGYESVNGSDIGNLNIVNNYYEYGPGTNGGSLRYKITGGGGWNVYADGNYTWGYPNITADNWSGGIHGTYVRYDTPFEAFPITQQTAEVARKYVVANAGAKRDSADVRFLNEMQTRTYSFAGLKNGKLYPGIPDSMDQVGGWPTLNSLPAPVDTDRDGMPDVWETANGLSPTNPQDGNSYTLDASYTNLEVYLNSLCPDPYTISQGPVFEMLPNPVNSTSITMSSTAVRDPFGTEYYFACTSGGGHDSGWQDSTVYTDTDLNPDATYTYAVKARSKGISSTETPWSEMVSVTTQSLWAERLGPNYAHGRLQTAASASSATFAGNIAMVNNGVSDTSDNSSRWVSTAAIPTIVTFILPEARYISAARIVSGHNNAGTLESAITDFRFEYWDGGTWRVVGNSTVKGNTKNVWTGRFDAAASDRFRLTIFKTPFNYARLWEVELYHPDADLTSDGAVDLADLEAFAEQWLSAGYGWSADFHASRSDTVDLADLGVLAEFWGW
jgi:hypothetical protein